MHPRVECHTACHVVRKPAHPGRSRSTRYLVVMALVAGRMRSPARRWRTDCSSYYRPVGDAVWARRVRVCGSHRSYERITVSTTTAPRSAISRRRRSKGAAQESAQGAAQGALRGSEAQRLQAAVSAARGLSAEKALPVPAEVRPAGSLRRAAAGTARRRTRRPARAAAHGRRLRPGVEADRSAGPAAGAPPQEPEGAARPRAGQARGRRPRGADRQAQGAGRRAGAEGNRLQGVLPLDRGGAERDRLLHPHRSLPARAEGAPEALRLQGHRQGG